MRYPRPQSPDQDQTAPPAKKHSGGGLSSNEDIPTETPADSRHVHLGDEPNQTEHQEQTEDRDHLVVERRLQIGLTTLRRVVASYEAGEPLPRGLGGVDDDILGSTPHGNSRDRDYIMPPHGLKAAQCEVARRDTSGANSGVTHAGQKRRKIPSTPGGAEALTGVTGTPRPSTTGDSEKEEGGQASETSKATPPSTALASPRSQESGTSGSKACSSPNGGNTRSSEASDSGRSEGGGTRSSSLSSKQESGSTLKSNEAVENGSNRRPEPFGFADGSGDAEGHSNEDSGGPPPGMVNPDEGARDTSNGEVRENLQISPVLCGRDGSLLVRAADLEAGAQEARRLASLAATTCEDLDGKESALAR